MGLPRHPPLSTYVPALNAGPFHLVRRETDGHELGLACRRSLAAALDRDPDELSGLTAAGLALFGERFALPFLQRRYDQVFVPEVGGTVENHGCVTWSDAFVYRSAPSRGSGSSARRCCCTRWHMWFGDMVPLRWWDDLWLTEAFGRVGLPLGRGGGHGAHRRVGVVPRCRWRRRCGRVRRACGLGRGIVWASRGYGGSSRPGERGRRAEEPVEQQPHVVDVPESSRFEVLVDGELAGFAEYRRDDATWAFTHTVVDPRFEGRGLGTVLVRAALEAARAQGAGVLPHCTFVRDVVQRNPDHLELVPVERRAEFALAPPSGAPDVEPT